MDIERLSKWADKLLDTGKRNNLINFKDSKLGTVEIVFPDYKTLWSKIEHAARFEVYDSVLQENEVLREEKRENFFTKESYISKYSKNLKRNQILLWSKFGDWAQSLKNISKKQKIAIEETGVNIVYIAFGFIHYTDSENSNYEFSAPLLLSPVHIENTSPLSPYYVELVDDVIVNPTFAYKVLYEYRIKIPEYNVNDGIEKYLKDISSLFSKFQWNVTTECKIGTFSFLKMNMYEDLKENIDKIAQNRNVRILLGETIEADTNSYEELSDESKKAKEYDFTDLHNVVDADSSQEEAIKAAKQGESFVLQGPPGTGKSQTITNIIAECLSDGKKVLFVSEKLAALSVVYNKLKSVGLDEFCLEIHSHKVNKKDFISELCNTMESEKKTIGQKAQLELQNKQKIEQQLNDYAVELHRHRNIINKSLYQMYEELSSCNNVERIDFVIDNISNKGEEHLTLAENLLSNYSQYIELVGKNYHENPWCGYVNIDNSYEGTIKLKEDLKEFITVIVKLKRINKKINSTYKITGDSIDDILFFDALFEFFSKSEYLNFLLINVENIDDIKNIIKQLRDIVPNIKCSKEKLENVFDDNIYKLDGKALHRKLATDFSYGISRLFSSTYKNIIKEIKICKKDGKSIKYEDAVKFMYFLYKYQVDMNTFEALKKQIAYLFENQEFEPNTDFDKVLENLEVFNKNFLADKRIYKVKSGTFENFASQKSMFENISGEINKVLSDHDEVIKRISNGFDTRKYNIYALSFNSLSDKFEKCLINIDKLDTWSSFIKFWEKLDSNDLLSFVETAIKHNISPENIVAIYKNIFYTQWIDLVLHNSPVLSELSRIPHDKLIEQFKEKDKLSLKINRTKIKSQLSIMRPDIYDITPGSQVAILCHEGEKKRRQKSIRQLLLEIKDLIQILKPCFLMSPLSVSTFLSPDMSFDVVIFDEASQIFPWDAIGAIYRAKQLIVVGDSQQMPPSNQFMCTNDSDDDEEEDIDDFESILDLCSSSFRPRNLSWHYRSRNESLIAFSNKNFYNNKLITFPSSRINDKGLGVDFFYVENGIFDGISKTNKNEAEKVVELVFYNFRNYPERSVGVVAFNKQQSDLIEKLIYAERQKYDEFEEFFKSDREEPFFVKNLENVQGDERDIIIFSATYAKNSASNKLFLNFGPINKSGGERRLNVAFTRAKYNIQLVSSIHYYDIDVSRTNSVGVRLLREYLDYAENGNIGLQRSIKTDNSSLFEEFDSEFEVQVSKFLRENGFCVDTQVGCSSFRIDLALKTPDSSNYVLAIECDGATYHSSKTARDRDRLRQEILEGMGWTFYRIWSTDWFRNNKEEKNRLLTAATNALNRN